MAGFGYSRFNIYLAPACCGFNVGSAENDYHAQYRPKAATTEPDDAVDDAADVPLPQFTVPEWTGPLLGGI